MSDKIDPDDRRKAHEALDRWLNQCEHESARAWGNGNSGHLGEFKLQASAWDEGITLTVERSFVEAL